MRIVSALTSSMPPRRLGETGPNTVNCPDWLLAVLYPARCLSSRSMLSGRRGGTTGLGFLLRRGAVRGGTTGLGGVAGAVALGGVVTGRGGIGCAWPSVWPTANQIHMKATAPQRKIASYPRPYLSVLKLILLANLAAEIVAVFGDNIKPAFRIRTPEMPFFERAHFFCVERSETS